MRNLMRNLMRNIMRNLMRNEWWLAYEGRLAHEGRLTQRRSPPVDSEVRDTTLQKLIRPLNA